MNNIKPFQLKMSKINNNKNDLNTIKKSRDQLKNKIKKANNLTFKCRM